MNNMTKFYPLLLVYIIVSTLLVLLVFNLVIDNVALPIGSLQLILAVSKVVFACAMITFTCVLCLIALISVTTDLWRYKISRHDTSKLQTSIPARRRDSFPQANVVRHGQHFFR